MNKQIASEGSDSQLNNGIAYPGQIKGSNDFASSVTGASDYICSFLPILHCGNNPRPGVNRWPILLLR